MPPRKDHVVGTGNVFADLGYPRPEEAAAKAELAHKIARIIERRRLTQAEAAEAVTHLAFYVGWPNVFSALPVVKEVFEKRAR